MSRRPSVNERMDDDIAVINSRLASATRRLAATRRVINEFESYMEANGLYERVVLTPRPQTRPPLILRMMGLGSWEEKMGLSKEQISERLHVMKRKVDGKCEGEEVDSCAICLGDYEENVMIGIVECGHQFHAECIKGWLLSKNVCPVCRATALTA